MVFEEFDMKMLAQTAHTVELRIFIEIRFLSGAPVSGKVAASEAFDSMDLSHLELPVINVPEGMRLDTDSEAYSLFLDAVDAMDDLLSRRGFQVLGESEDGKSDTESVYRGIVVDAVKALDGERLHVKMENGLRVSAHPETRSMRRGRLKKIQKSANSEEARALNGGKPLEVGSFDSIVVRCTASEQGKANVPNKEFYSYKDTIEWLDHVLDTWGNQGGERV